MITEIRAFGIYGYKSIVNGNKEKEGPGAA
jgi:hypothetical protein